MEIIIGFLTGAFLTWAIAKRLMVEWKKDLKKLKDFDTWKEWKNKKLGPDGNPILREDGKIIKPQGFKKVELKDILNL